MRRGVFLLVPKKEVYTLTVKGLRQNYLLVFALLTSQPPEGVVASRALIRNTFFFCFLCSLSSNFVYRGDCSFKRDLRGGIYYKKIPASFQMIRGF